MFGDISTTMLAVFVPALYIISGMNYFLYDKDGILLEAGSYGNLLGIKKQEVV